jgi:hypothetical protein
VTGAVKVFPALAQYQGDVAECPLNYFSITILPLTKIMKLFEFLSSK